jgi:DNA-binding NarL/FixJ family response regulator
MDEKELRLLIVADDPLARAGLAALFAQQTELTVVGQTSSDGDLWSDLEIFQPDAILCDLGWDPATTIARLGELAEAGLPLILLLPAEVDLTDVLTIEPRGLLSRNATPKQLKLAVLAAVQGMVTLDPAFMPEFLPDPQIAPPLPIEPLTPRELEVLQHLAEGLPNKAIARRLEISEHTVKFHVNAIMTKLGVQSRTAAVVRATQLSLILL